MIYNCEYRCVNVRTNTYSLYINEKPVGMSIFNPRIGLPGRSPVRLPTFWFATGGPDKTQMRQYSSLEAAFQGEKALLDRLSRTGDLLSILESLGNTQTEHKQEEKK